MTIVVGAVTALAALLLLTPPARATDAGPANIVVAQGPTARKLPPKSVTQSAVKKHGGWQTDTDWQIQKQQHFGPCYPFGCDYRGPSYPFGHNYSKAPVYAGPVYVAPNHPGRRWVAGHWTPQWVPQYSVYQVWVPGYYSGTWWVPGHYEQQSAEAGGYYQQVWVDGYWEE